MRFVAGLYTRKISCEPASNLRLEFVLVLKLWTTLVKYMCMNRAWTVFNKLRRQQTLRSFPCFCDLNINKYHNMYVTFITLVFNFITKELYLLFYLNFSVYVSKKNNHKLLLFSLLKDFLLKMYRKNLSISKKKTMKTVLLWRASAMTT